MCAAIRFRFILCPDWWLLIGKRSDGNCNYAFELNIFCVTESAHSVIGLSAQQWQRPENVTCRAFHTRVRMTELVRACDGAMAIYFLCARLDGKLKSLIARPVKYESDNHRNFACLMVATAGGEQ